MMENKKDMAVSFNHDRVRLRLEMSEYALMHIFRFEDGSIIEKSVIIAALNA